MPSPQTIESYTRPELHKIVDLYNLGFDLKKLQKEIQNVGLTILIFSLAALVIWLFEFTVERVILKDPEIWAVRLSSLARILTIILSPILALPLRLSHAEKTAKELNTITEDELKKLDALINTATII